jgi:hypothetical protein
VWRSSFGSQVQFVNHLFGRPCVYKPWKFQLIFYWNQHMFPNHWNLDKLFDHLKFSYDISSNDDPWSSICFAYFATYSKSILVDVGKLINLWNANKIGAKNCGDVFTKAFGNHLTHCLYLWLLVWCLFIELDKTKGCHSLKVHDVMKDTMFQFI